MSNIHEPASHYMPAPLDRAPLWIAQTIADLLMLADSIGAEYGFMYGRGAMGAIERGAEHYDLRRNGLNADAEGILEVLRRVRAEEGIPTPTDEDRPERQTQKGGGE